MFFIKHLQSIMLSRTTVNVIKYSITKFFCHTVVLTMAVATIEYSFSRVAKEKSEVLDLKDTEATR